MVSNLSKSLPSFQKRSEILAMGNSTTSLNSKRNDTLKQSAPSTPPQRVFPSYPLPRTPQDSSQVKISTNSPTSPSDKQRLDNLLSRSAQLLWDRPLRDSYEVFFIFLIHLPTL